MNRIIGGQKMDEKNIKKMVRESYGKIAKQNSSCCGPETSCGCCVDNKFNEEMKILIENLTC